MRKQKCLFFYRVALLTIMLISIYALNSAQAQSEELPNIKNDIFWQTKDGQPINSQGGGVFRFKDPKDGIIKYYWYGVHYKEADAYRKTPSITQPKSTFESVTCYSSVDLVNWTFEGNVLTKEEVNKSGKTWVGRLGVAFIKELNKYAMFVQHGNQVLITVSDSPTGAFKWHQQIDMLPIIGTHNTGDQTVFTDEDSGISYLIYSYGRGRNKIYVSEIGVKDGKVNLLDCTQVYRGAGREGNCMFKYMGKYYMCASNLYGWDGSFAYYLVSDNIRGPYKPTDEMEIMKGSTEDYAHVSQTGFFITVKGSHQETVIFCGDRWADFAGNGLGYNQWCPLSFEREIPHFNSLSSWNLNAKTGEWVVGKNNNFVKNGSFEADRRSIPSPVKPVQEQLLGWTSVVLSGNPISVGSSISPVLNHFNTEKERKIVIGEKSLNISDSVDFSRKVYQHIASTPFVKLKDGYYTLSAKIKNSPGFSNLEMYAESNGQRLKYSIDKKNEDWITIKIDRIPIRKGAIEVGFLAKGEAGAYCFIDDISLVERHR